MTLVFAYLIVALDAPIVNIMLSPAKHTLEMEVLPYDSATSWCAVSLQKFQSFWSTCWLCAVAIVVSPNRAIMEIARTGRLHVDPSTVAPVDSALTPLSSLIAVRLLRFGMKRIVYPGCGIVLNVGSDAVEITVIPDDVVIVVPMPEPAIVGWPA